MNYAEIKTLKGQVSHVLERVPETRNDDILLTVYIWRWFYASRLSHTGDGSECVKLAALWDLPREDNVKRVRAHFQNVKRQWLPTSEAVAKKRGILIDEWRAAMGYPTQDTAGTDSPSWTPPSQAEPVTG